MIRFLAAFNLLITIPAFSQIYTVQTFAGGGLPQNIQGSAADLSGISFPPNNVSAVVADGSGNVFIALAIDSIVVKLDSTGLLTLVAGNGIVGFAGDGGPAIGAQLNTPTGIALDALGNLYIADSANHRVRRVSGGIITTVAGNGVAGYNGDNIPATSAWLLTPASVAIDAGGNLYIADVTNQRIREVSNGIISTIAGTGIGGFSGDNGPATAAQVTSPSGIAVDSSGNLYIADTGNQRVRKISNQTIVTVAGTGGFSFSSDNIPATSAALENPSGVGLDGAGNLYITEAIGRRVRKVASGIITTVTGTGIRGYNGDGIAASGAFVDSPSGVALDMSGNVYIADTGNSRVRRVAGGIITTVAGGGTLPNYGDGGPPTTARLPQVGSVIVDAVGTVYLAEGFRTSKVSNDVITSVKAIRSTDDAGTEPHDIGGGPMAVDSNGNLYFVANNSVLKVSNGTSTLVAGAANGFQGFSGDNGPATNAELDLPSAMVVDGAGNIYIADLYNYRIRMVSNGIITTIAGNGVSGYSGDGGPAVNAQLSFPGGLGIDAAGNLYIADGVHIREISGGAITTIATFPEGPPLIAVNATGGIYMADISNGKIYKMTGGVPVTIGQVGLPGIIGPLGIAVDSAGNVYVSDQSTHRILRLIPTQSGCATAVNPATLAVTYVPMNYAFTVQADASCFWTIGGLPDWITVSAQGSGAGASIVTLSVVTNMGSARGAQFNIGGVPVAISQDASPPCTYSFVSAGHGFPATGGTGSQVVTRNLYWCPLTATNAPDWVTITSVVPNLPNSGLVNYSVAANSGPARSGTVLIAGLPFTIEQQGSIPGLGLIGSMPHIAAEENWTTTFTLVNKGASPAQARFSAFGESGNPVLLPLLFPQQPPAPGWLLAASLDRTVAGNASLLMSTAAIPTAPVLVGTAQIGANGAVDGFAIFHLIPGAQEAVVPLETRNASSYLLAFDNTNGVVLGVAVGNVSTQAASVAVVIRDDTGAQIATGSVALPADGHKSFVLSTLFPVTVNGRGTIEFDAPAGGQISVLGIRTTPLGGSNTLTTIPPLANVGTSGGSMAHLAVANGWKTTFVLVNTGASAAQARLKFFDDQGNPLLLPLSFPQSGGGASSVDSRVDRALPAGATLVVESTGALTDALLTGSAQLTTDGNIGGFVIFRYQPNGQEAVVPLENRGAGAYLVAFDNTNGTATGIAVNNASAQGVSIPVVIRDDTGTQIGSDTIALAANGHSSFTLVVDKYAMTAGIRGTLEFDTPAGSQIGALGIRIPQAHTFTTLPALAK